MSSTSATLLDSSTEYKVSGKARRFFLTLNQPEHYDKIREYLTGMKAFKYMFSCKEKAPTTGHAHIHIYVIFSSARKLSVRALPGAHLDVCNGSHAQCVDYIRKEALEGSIIEELGTEPRQGSLSRYTVGELRKITDPTDLPSHYLKQWRESKAFNVALTKAECYKPKVDVLYFVGPSAAGKSKAVYDHLADDEKFDRVKHVNGFWINVSQDPSVTTAWYDDFRDSDMKPSEFINFIDYYANPMNLKGGYVLNHYTKIFITSVQHPSDLYAGMRLEEPRKQWMRRMEIIEME